MPIQKLYHLASVYFSNLSSEMWKFDIAALMNSRTKGSSILLIICVHLRAGAIVTRLTSIEEMAGKILLRFCFQHDYWGAAPGRRSQNRHTHFARLLKISSIFFPFFYCLFYTFLLFRLFYDLFFVDICRNSFEFSALGLLQTTKLTFRFFLLIGVAVSG